MENKPLALNIRCDRPSLIEASAGTGKTFTMAQIYLRLILGVDCLPMMVDQILVVTYTNDATQELRDRIRQKILDAHRFFKGEEVSEDREFLQLLFDDCEDKELALSRLKVAAESMDLAAIYTIHSFCQKMLTQFSFSAGMPLELELQADETPLRHKLSEEVWRELYYPLDLDSKALVKKWLGHPHTALEKVKNFLGIPTPKINAVQFSIPAYLANKTAAMAEIKAYWQNVAPVFSAFFKEQFSLGSLKANIYKEEKTFNSFDEITLWAQSDSVEMPNFELFTETKINSGRKKDSLFEMPSEAVQLEEKIKEYQSQFSDNAEKGLLLHQFFCHLQQKLDEYKQHHRDKSFNDLLTLLNRALKSAQGETLASQIRGVYAFAMIDEFQDTDLQQYQIFSRIFMQPENPCGFVMIGDPKQSIYKFRGADIFTYYQARNAVKNEDRKHLGTNYRSAPKLVEAVNHLFTMNGDNPPFLSDKIIFESVESKSKPELQGNNAQNLMIYLQSQEKMDHALAAKQCAIQIQHQLKNAVEGNFSLHLKESTPTQEEAERIRDKWLKTEQEKKREILTDFQIRNENGQFVVEGNRPILPQDMAILVRGKKQAKRIKDALNELGIASVYLSERESVYSSQEASDLYDLLNACLNPKDQRAILKTLGTLLWAQTANELLNLKKNDTSEWDNWIEKFEHFHQIWLKKGILVMLYHIFSNENVLQKMQTLPNSDRRITNLFHLAELLQQASLGLENAHALLRYFKQQLDSPAESSDEHELRLESEQGLIKIITIHKSKGLQYPVVWLPFICEPDKHLKADFTILRDRNDQIRWNFESDDDDSNEQHAEELRLLYVAVTRAESQLNLILPAQFNAKQWNPLIYLLSDGDFNFQKPKEPLDILQSFTQKHIAYGSVALEEFSAWENWQFNAVVQPELHARTMPHKIVTHKGQKTSYTALYAAHTRQLNGEESTQAAFDHKDDEGEQITHSPASKANGTLSCQNLPRGKQVGTALHHFLEHLDFQQTLAYLNDASNIEDDEKTQKIAQKFTALCERIIKQEPEKWLDIMKKWVANILTTPFSAAQFSLSQVQKNKQLKEWHFFLRLRNDQALAQLNKLLIQHSPLPAKTTPLKMADLGGFVDGIVDNFLEYQGKYYIIDYKSNALDDYLPETLKHAIIQHRYDLQYWLYTLASHRYLAFRLGENYDYERDFGGVAYLFLRGMTSEPNSGVYFTKLPKAVIESLDEIFDE